jgi:hypothetical protein
LNTIYCQMIQFFTCVQRTAREVLFIKRYCAFFIVWMISQFFPCVVQAELLNDRQFFNVVSDNSVMHFKGFIRKSETSALVGLDQGVKFWQERISNCFSSCGPIVMVSSGYAQEMAQKQNRNCPDCTKGDLIFANDSNNVVDDWHDLLYTLPMWIIALWPNANLTGRKSSQNLNKEENYENR